MYLSYFVHDYLEKGVCSNELRVVDEVMLAHRFRFHERYLLVHSVVGWFYENRIFYSLEGCKFRGMDGEQDVG